VSDRGGGWLVGCVCGWLVGWSVLVCAFVCAFVSACVLSWVEILRRSTGATTKAAIEYGLSGFIQGTGVGSQSGTIDSNITAARRYTSAHQGSCGRRGGRSLRSFSMLPPPYGPKQVTAGKSYPSSPLSQPAVSLRSTYIAWTSLRMPLSERFNAL